MTVLSKIHGICVAALADVWFMVCGLLALRALVHPYSGFRHDALLYSVQVTNRALAGLYNEDLFFAFGSQDSFSIFSYLIAPLASLVDIENAFWISYWVFTAVLVFAQVGIVKQLVHHPLAAFATLVFLTISRVPYGGRRIFHVNEDFFTARLAAEALVLLGLDQLLRGRRVVPLGLAMLAVLVHPLMGIGGLALFAGFVLCQSLSGRWFAGILSMAGICASAVLLHPTWATTLLGHCDTLWFTSGYVVSRHCFLTQWWWTDWLRIAMAILAVLAARRYVDRTTSDLGLMVCVLAIGSLAVTLIGETGKYSILIQGQAYRALWLVQFLAIPMVAIWVQHLIESARPRSQVTALLVLSYWLGLIPFGRLAGDRTLAMATMSVGLGGIAYLFTRRRLIRHRAMFAGVTALSGWTLLWSLHNSVALTRYMGFVPHNVLSVWNCLFLLTSLSIWVLLAIVALLAAYVWLPRYSLAIALPIVLVTMFALQRSESIQAQIDVDRASIPFVKNWLDDHKSGDLSEASLEQVYWPGEPTRIWIELQRNSYYSWPQLQGLLFSRPLVVESLRRRNLVGRFEVANMQRLLQSGGWADRHRAFLGLDQAAPKPTESDLFALARDTKIQWIILTDPISPAYEATDGQVYIYDAARLRSEQQATSRLVGRP